MCDSDFVGGEKLGKVRKKDSHPSRTRERTHVSTERCCRLVYGKTSIDVPTAFVVLPYELKIDRSRRSLRLKTTKDRKVATRIGQLMLEIIKTTAKLSFWLQLTRHLSECPLFKGELKEWLRRARSESADVIAQEIIDGLALEQNYIDICKEMLQCKDKVSNARAFIRDPMCAAHKEISEKIDLLLQCYKGRAHFFYLIDERRMSPVPCVDSTYPIRTKLDLFLLEKSFFPLMNISVMSALVAGGLSSIKKVLGLDSCSQVPENWKETASASVIHHAGHQHTITAFASFQRTLRLKYLLEPTGHAYIFGEDHSSSQDGSHKRKEVRDDAIHDLQSFYRENDSGGEFCRLRRKTIGENLAIWTGKRDQTLQSDSDSSCGDVDVPARSSLELSDSQKKDFASRANEEIGRSGRCLQLMKLKSYCSKSQDTMATLSSSESSTPPNMSGYSFLKEAFSEVTKIQGQLLPPCPRNQR